MQYTRKYVIYRFIPLAVRTVRVGTVLLPAYLTSLTTSLHYLTWPPDYHVRCSRVLLARLHAWVGATLPAER